MLPPIRDLIADTAVTIQFSAPEPGLSAGDDPTEGSHVTFWVRPCGRARWAELADQATDGDQIVWSSIAREAMIECVVGVESSATDGRAEFTAADAAEVCDVWPAHMFVTLLGAIIDVNQVGANIPKAR